VFSGEEKCAFFHLLKEKKHGRCHAPQPYGKGEGRRGAIPIRANTTRKKRKKKKLGPSTIQKKGRGRRHDIRHHTFGGQDLSAPEGVFTSLKEDRLLEKKEGVRKLESQTFEKGNGDYLPRRLGERGPVSWGEGLHKEKRRNPSILGKKKEETNRHTPERRRRWRFREKEKSFGYL